MSESKLTPRTPVLRWVGFALLLLAFPLLAHYMIVTSQTGPLGAAVALLPVTVMSIVFAWKSAHTWIWLTLIGAVLATIFANLHWLDQRHGMLYWLQEASFQSLLFITFARTLFAGRKPLCTEFAEMAHGEISAKHARYAMQITWAWSAFFGAMVLISTLLFFFTPLPMWSVFSNFLYLPLVLLMLTVELLVRRKRLPEMYGNRFWESFKISWNSVRNKRADNETRRSDA